MARRLAFLFGPERTGLSNDDLIYADAVLTVPLNPWLQLAQSRSGGPANRL